MQKSIIILIILFQQFSFAQSQTKIIDMHIHSYTKKDLGERAPASDYYDNKGSSDAETHGAEFDGQSCTIVRFETFSH